MTLQKNMRLEMTVEDFGAQGEGICRHDGMAVFVPRALPGERILAQIIKVEKRHAFARVVEVADLQVIRRFSTCLTTASNHNMAQHRASEVSLFLDSKDPSNLETHQCAIHQMFR